MKRLVSFSLTALLAVLSGIFLQAAAEDEEIVSQMLADFEDPAQAEKFIPMRNNPQKVTHVSDPALVISGQGSGCWYVPKAGTGANQWPRAAFHLPEELSDWDLYDRLEMDLVNPLDKLAPFCLDVYDFNNNYCTTNTRLIAPGKSSLVWNFDDKIRGRKLSHFLLITSKPDQEYTLYIDNIRLITTRSSFMKRVKHQLTLLYGDWPKNEWERGGMLREFQDFEQRLNVLLQARAPLKELFPVYTAIVKEYQTAKLQLIARLNELPVKEFERMFPASAVWGYGWTTGMQKVYRADLPYQGKIGGAPELALARREAEGFQIVLRTHKALEKVTVKVGELRSAGGAILPPENVKIYTVAHLKPKTPGYPVDAAQWRPDPLLEYLKEIPLEPDVWQAFFVDIATTAETQPGVYHGLITASADGAPELKIPLAVKVWNFTIPEALTQPRLVNFGSDRGHWAYIDNDQEAGNQYFAFREYKVAYEELSPKSRKLWDMELRIRELLLDHLLSPISLYATLRRHEIYDLLYWETRRGSWYNITYVPPMKVEKNQPYQPAWMRERIMKNLEILVPELVKYGIFDKCFLYSFDEIAEDKFFSAVDILSEIKAKYPDIQIVTTAYDPSYGASNGLDKVIDCWCPQVERFVEEIDKVREVQKKGKKVWYYSCLWDPGMDMLVEKPLTSVRLLTGLNQVRLKADGFLYYSVTASQETHKAISSTTPLTDHDGNSYGYTGEGNLIYATVTGPEPSIRLKALRDGLEDIEYAHLLEKIPFEKMSETDRQEREKLLAIPEALISHLEIYDKTGEELTRWRNQSGVMLEKYSSVLPAEVKRPVPSELPPAPVYAKSAPGAEATPDYPGGIAEGN